MADLLPADLALPDDAEPPFTDELLDTIEGADLVAPPVLASTAEAEYTMVRLAAVTALIEDARAQRAAWVTKIDEWFDAVTRGPLRRAEFLSALLEAWGVHERLANPKRATLPLPSGVVETRQGTAPTVVLADEDAVIQWAADALDGATYDLVVKTTSSVRISELRKVVAIEEVAGDVIIEKDGVGTPTGLSHQEPSTWRVRHIEGDLVPGVVVELPETTAKVKPSTV